MIKCGFDAVDMAPALANSSRGVDLSLQVLFWNSFSFSMWIYAA